MSAGRALLRLFVPTGSRPWVFPVSLHACGYPGNYGLALARVSAFHAAADEVIL